MNSKATLTITSLLTILLSSFHLADDVVRGIEPGGTSNARRTAMGARAADRSAGRWWVRFELTHQLPYCLSLWFCATVTSDVHGVTLPAKSAP